MASSIWIHTLFLVKLCVLCSHAQTKPCSDLKISTSPPNVIKIGVILPFHGDHPWVVQAAFPAIMLAKETVENASNILPGYRIFLNLADSACSETIGPLAAIDMYIKQSAHVFVGPACEYAIAPVARFSYYWGIPILTAGGMVSAFEDKREYKLLTRVQGPLAKGSEFVLGLFTLFHWKNMAIIYGDKKGPNTGKKNCYFSAEAVFNIYNKRYNKRPYIESFNEDLAFIDFQKLLKDGSLQSRSKY